MSASPAQIGQFALTSLDKAGGKNEKMNLHFWISLIGGTLVTVFAAQTRFYLSFVLRVPGMILGKYIPISGIIEIWYGGYVALRISILQVAFYSFVIYLSIRLLSQIGNWRRNAGLSNVKSFVVGV
jgi:hypothetical protein